jgi:RNA-directed DNA polymerase
MARMAQRISDKRGLKLIRRFLQAGVMENGLVSPVDEGAPQGPLSPLLSNIVLELDRELASCVMQTIATSMFAANVLENE